MYKAYFYFQAVKIALARFLYVSVCVTEMEMECSGTGKPSYACNHILPLGLDLVLILFMV